MASRRLLLSSIRSSNGFRRLTTAPFLGESKLLTAKVIPTSSNFQKHFSSNANNNDNNNDIPDIDMKNISEIVESERGGAPSPQTIPDVYPDVPLIAVNRYPCFPGFIKKVDIVNDKKLQDILRQRVAMRQPYVGVFVKKDDENKNETVSSLDEIYNVGSFAQILEMRDLGVVVELVLSAHRRIKITEALDDNGTDARDDYSNSPVARFNNRRTKQKEEDAKKEAMEEAIGDVPKTEDKRIVFVRTENVGNTPIERTTEIKASMQAVVQNFKEIVHYSPLFGQQVNLLLYPAQHVIENPVYLCDLVATMLQSADTNDLQQMLEEEKIQKRLDHAKFLLIKEKMLTEVEKKVQEQYRKHLLNELGTICKYNPEETQRINRWLLGLIIIFSTTGFSSLTYLYSMDFPRVPSK